jgi:hypothetical protein
MGEWGNGEFQLKPQHPKTPTPALQTTKTQFLFPKILFFG